MPTKVVSLCLANTFPCFNLSLSEIQMAEAFEAILKNGANNPVIKQALLCHLMAGEDMQLIVICFGRVSLKGLNMC